MKENRQGCLSRSIRADALKSAKRYVLPRPKTHKPAPTQGEGCVKGEPLRCPLRVSSGQMLLNLQKGMRSPPSSAPIKSTPAGVLFIGAEDGGERIPFCRFKSICPDETRRGHRKGSPFTHPSPCVGAGLCVLGRGSTYLFADLRASALMERERQP